MAQNITSATAQLSENVNHLVDYFEFIHIENPYIKAFLVLAIFIFLSLILRVLFVRVLSRIVASTKSDIDDLILDTVKTPIVLIIIILGFFISGLTLDLHNFLGSFYTNFFITIESFIFFILIFDIIKIIARGIRNTLKTKDIKIFDSKIWPFFERSIVLLLFIIYLFVFFAIWRINLAPLLASAGIAGIAIAFAAKDTIANIFGGISIFFDKTYEIGDYIIVDDKDRGEVIDIGFRSTKLRTRDDVLITIPNSIMSTSKVVNESGIHPKLRIRIDIDVSYNSDLEEVERVLLDLAKSREYVEKNPEPRVRFRGFKDFSIGLQLLFWIKKPVLKGRHTHQIIKDIYKEFKKKGIDFPYPTQDLYIKGIPSAKNKK